MTQPQLSIIICTYNRGELLRQCLSALAGQQTTEPYEVIIVDNNSPDGTAEIAREFTDQYPYFRYVLERQVGLSFARNTGYREARAEWVAYLDDDAKAAPNFVDRALWMIQTQPYPFFGGRDLPWYPFGRPRWIRDRYVANFLPHEQVATLGTNEYAHGCLMVMRRDVLEQSGGFNTELGMRGNTVGYNEETDLQDRLRAGGLRIGYDPELKIDHAVAPHKLQLDWFFRAAFALGRDRIISGMTSSSVGNLLLIALVGIGLTSVSLVINSFRWAFQKDYYVENWLIDTFRKAAKRVGMLYTGLIFLYGEKTTDGTDRTDLHRSNQ